MLTFLCSSLSQSRDLFCAAPILQDDYDDGDDDENLNICQRERRGHYCYEIRAPYSQQGSDSPAMAYNGGFSAGFAAVRTVLCFGPRCIFNCTLLSAA